MDLAVEIGVLENSLDGNRRELDRLRRTISDDEDRLAALRAQLAAHPKPGPGIPFTPPALPPDALARYGRQLVLREVGLAGQLSLSRARVLVVGAGGLGVPAATYLAGAGVGHVTVADGDAVEVGNLARQFVYGPCVGRSKAESLVEFMSRLNPLGVFTAHPAHVTPATAPALFAAHDLVLDCTDAPWTRYLLSDAAVAAGKPLISGAALRLDAQLLVVNQPPGKGPCYRCVFPRPPHLVGEGQTPTCADAGVLGPVVGMAGCLMATRALTMLVPPPPPPPPATTPSGDAHGDGERRRQERLPPAFDPDAEPARDMLLFSAGASPPFRSVRLRARRPGCLACGEPPSGAEERAESGAERERAYDPPDSCAPLLPPLLATTGDGGGGPSVSDGQGDGPPRVSARELAGSEARARVLLDVRPRAQFELCALRGSVNAPWDEQAGGWDRGRWVAEARAVVAKSEGGGQRRVYVLCRNGIDSQAAARALREGGGEGWVGDVVGGLRAWRQEVDARFPDY